MEVHRPHLTAVRPDGTQRPAMHSFGTRGPDPVPGGLSREEPIEIQAGARTLRLNGRMDRLNWDQERTAFRVVYYKTGRMGDEKAGQLQGGRMLQLPLYVLAAAQLLGIVPCDGRLPSGLLRAGRR